MRRAARAFESLWRWPTPSRFLSRTCSREPRSWGSGGTSVLGSVCSVAFFNRLLAEESFVIQSPLDFMTHRHSVCGE